MMGNEAVMSSVQVLGLHSAGDARIALESVTVAAVLRGLVVEATIEQRYRNLEAIPIEAVYTFPLPLSAVLLELVFERGGKVLRGVVQPRETAQRGYEDAIDGGNTAVLLEQAGPGLYTINAGNLLAGDDVVVRIRYAQLLYWQGDSLRFWLPTTIAPRYGEARAAGLESYQEPTFTLAEDVRFMLTVTIAGPLARAPFECPSHPMAVEDREGMRVLRLSGTTVSMDRDFVLVLREPEPASTEALVAPDGSRSVVMASFRPQLDAPTLPASRKLIVLVDCSGSMAGDSIAQARTAVREILDSLSDHDAFNVIAFGSSHTDLFPRLTPVDSRSLAQAQAFLDELDADLGGTEIGAALDAAYRQRANEVLLITDGEVWDDGRMVATARQSGSRIFPIGVGHSVAEGLLSDLAHATGGALELVSPREDMAERIVRHFQRMDQPMAAQAVVHWPANPIQQVPAVLERVFLRDTLHVFGGFEEPPVGPVTLDIALPNGQRIRQTLECPGASEGAGVGSPDVLTRLAAHQQLAYLDAAQAQGLAVDYQLVTEHTACLLVESRADVEKVDRLPALRRVPSVLAAGSHGAGSRRRSPMRFGIDLGHADPPPADSMNAFLAESIRFSRRGGESAGVPQGERKFNSPRRPSSAGQAIHRFIHALVFQLAMKAGQEDGLEHFDRADWLDLLAEDPMPGILETTAELAAEPGTSREEVAVALLAALIDVWHFASPPRHVSRVCRRLVRDYPVDDELTDLFRAALRSQGYA